MSGQKYPDMWVDPEDDPRETEVVAVGENAILAEYLDRYRTTFAMKCEGLTAEQLARRSVPPSTMSLLGLVRHLARVEHHWFRKHVSWYLKGFAAGGTLRRNLALVDSLAALDALLAELDPHEPFPTQELGSPRGRQGSPRARVVLPEGWLDDADGSGCHVHEDVSVTTGG